jgi:hypothetical protein
MLVACSISGDAEMNRVCRAMADHARTLAGVKRSSFTVVVHAHIASCSGVVDVQQDLASADVAGVVEGTYDSVRAAGVDTERVTTRFMTGSTTLVTVSSGFPKAREAKALLDLAASAQAVYLYLDGGSSDPVFGQIGVQLSSRAPAEALNQALGFVRTPLPQGVTGLGWGFNDSQIFIDRADAPEVAALDNVASWFARHPRVSAFTLSAQPHRDAWTLTTLVEAPDLVREFAAVAGAAGRQVFVKAQLTDENPYLSLP